MKLGIFSDVHDNIENLKTALAYFKAQGIDTLVFCGDFCSPIAAKMIGTYFSGNVHCVFGNGDGDRYAIANLARDSYKNIHLHGEYAELIFGSSKVAVTHYPFYGYALAKTGDYSAVFSGHTHVSHIKIHENCTWINPGEIMGHFGSPTVALFDTETHFSEIIELD